MTVELRPQPLTRERFAPYGDVIEANAAKTVMNAARFDRFDGLCDVDVDGEVAVSIARCRSATALPYRIDFVERHPLGSQAFVPLGRAKMIVVVAPPGEGVAASDLRAFESNGRQGVNYRRGTWHMPLIAFEAGQEFLVIDRAPGTANCDEHFLDDTVVLHGHRPGVDRP
jgi:ureidoglycolate lyase